MDKLSNEIMTESTVTLERIKYFLDKSDSDELVLLKGHLLIEELFDLIIVFDLGEEIAGKLNLNFHRKMLLVCGLTKREFSSDLICQIMVINKIRNKFAHNLDSNIKPDLIDFIKKVLKGLPKTINRKSTYLNCLKKSFYFIFGQLMGTYEVYKMVNKNGL